jgi:hypothetical protein
MHEYEKVGASQAFPGLNLDGTLDRFKVLTQDFGPSTGVDEWRFGTELSDVMVVDSTPSCDFNGDEFCDIDDCDIDDIDALVAEIVAGTDNPIFDLTRDGEVTLEDVTDMELGWVRLAGEENLGSGLSVFRFPMPFTTRAETRPFSRNETVG